MATMPVSEFHTGEHYRKEHPFEGFAVFHREASQEGVDDHSQDDQPAAVREPAPVSSAMAWHVLLAQLIASLRACLSLEGRLEFDAVHARTHAKKIQLNEFFAYALEVIRKNAPHMEPSYREVFRLRNASRRQAQQKLAASAARPQAAAASRMRASISMPDLQRANAEECMEEALDRLAGLNVSRSGSAEGGGLGSIPDDIPATSSLHHLSAVRLQSINGNYARKRSSEDLLSVTGQSLKEAVPHTWMTRDLKTRHGSY